MLVLDAPTGYSNAPTKMILASLIGKYPAVTARELGLEIWFQGGTGASKGQLAPNLVGELDCTVAGDRAAEFEYLSRQPIVLGPAPHGASFAGIIFVFIHADLLYAVQLEGTGGLDARAVDDAKAILGSWTWTGQDVLPT
jgi:hypothetical protein